MKQGLRFLLQPNTFFNQMQWSSKHWIFVLGFAVLAAIETQLTRSNSVYAHFAQVVEAKWGLSNNLSLWLVMVAKLAALVLGSYLMTIVIHIVGSYFGHTSSRRVFLRRAAVVFTVVLFGFIASQLAHHLKALEIVAFALYGWAVVLAFFAIREQFSLGFVESVFMSLFAIMLVGTSWQASQKLFENAVTHQLSEITKKVEPIQGPSHKKNLPL